MSASKKIRQLIPKLFIVGLLSLIALFDIIMICDNIVIKYSENKVYYDTDKIPTNKVGLLLGTNMYGRGGYVNRYFKYRIEATAKLYKAGKIKYIIVSGDNGSIYYNEPKLMKQELIKLGIPESAIYFDFAGFRTLDSVVRCKKVFGQEAVTIISQRFHNQRAIYIAGNNSVNAIGYNARDVSFRNGFKIRFRELLARVKVIIDIHFINKQPKFLGAKIEIK